MELSLKTSRKNTYLKELNDLLKNENILLIPIIKYSLPITSITQLPNILQNVTDEEREYLEEATGCAQRKFFRASIILGWCAVIHRIQKTIEKLGFDEFNKKSEELHSITTGRYKRFNKKFSIHNFSELQTVFDRDLLWIIEYWGLIDSNQNDRLNICFVMRNNSAHPGEATITTENLASFYSDIKTIIFENPNFVI